MLFYSNTYKTELTRLEILESISRRIISKEDNSWKNHLFPKDHSSQKLRGTSNNQSFIVWITNSYLLGSAYPICKGKISELNEMRTLNLTIRFNPIAEIFIIAFNMLLAYALITGVLIQENNAFNFIWKRCVVVVVIFFLINSVPLYIFYSGKNKLFKLIIDSLLEKQKSTEQSAERT